MYVPFSRKRKSTTPLNLCLICIPYLVSSAWQSPCSTSTVRARYGFAGPTLRTFTCRYNTKHDIDYINRASIWSVVWTSGTDEHHLTNDSFDKAKTEPLSIRFVPLMDNVSDNESICRRRAAETTWRWCAHFVARHNLCPWAEASVVDAGAIRIYVVNGKATELDMEIVLEAVAARFSDDLRPKKNQQGADPNTSICFVVLAPPLNVPRVDVEVTTENDEDWHTDFPTFYDWFVELEERWSLVDQVTLAPFHPKWQYDGDNPTAVQMEKQSPFPTISLVSTNVIDKAGPGATQKIADNNEAILLEKTMDEWREIYQATVFRSPRG
jgi:hypothetical protein